jgi:hypothetical protein
LEEERRWLRVFVALKQSLWSATAVVNANGWEASSLLLSSRVHGPLWRWSTLTVGQFRVFVAFKRSPRSATVVVNANG